MTELCIMIPFPSIKENNSWLVGTKDLILKVCDKALKNEDKGNYWFQAIT